MRTVTQIPSMGIKECYQWCLDAKEALMKVYQEDEAIVVVEWFRCIKGSNERELMGADKVNAHSEMIGDPATHFSVYASMMSRMWIYAPYIIEQAIANGELK